MYFIFMQFRYKILSKVGALPSGYGASASGKSWIRHFLQWMMLFFVIVDQLDKISPYNQIFLIKWRNLLNLSLWSPHIDKNRHGFNWNDFPERNLFRTLSRLLLQDSDQWTKSHTHSTTSTTFMLTFLVALFKVYSKKNTFMWQLDVE